MKSVYRKMILAATVAVLLIAQAVAAGEKPYVILVSFDGFRWDYPMRGFSPHLVKLGKRGVRALSFEPAFPSKTFPNHLSMITGLYAENHGIIANNFWDPFRDEGYSLRNPEAIREARWYRGEAFWETAERQGVTCASYFWPGSEVNLPYRRPTYFQPFDKSRPYEKRVQGVLDWLELPRAERPHFLTLYFDAVDSKGHEFGPDARETNQAIARVDSMLGRLINGLQQIGMLEKTNIIVVSDHGMTPIDMRRSVVVPELLGRITCRIQDNGPFMMLDPQNATVAETYAALKSRAEHYRVYRRADIPEYFHFKNNALIPPLLLVADMGWSLLTSPRKSWMKGHHGYDNHHLDMHGIFYAAGPAFRDGYATGTLHNVDLYPLLCKIFDLVPRQHIDGKLARIGFLLQE